MLLRHDEAKTLKRARQQTRQIPKGYQNGWGIKMADFFLKTRHVGTRLGVSLAAPKGVSQRMGYSFENLTFWYPFVLVPVWVSPRSTARELIWPPQGKDRQKAMWSNLTPVLLALTCPMLRVCRSGQISTTILSGLLVL